MQKYKIFYQDENRVKTQVLTQNEINSSSYNIIKIKKAINFYNIQLSSKIKDIDLVNLFYQLKVMLNAKILFIDAVNILIKNSKNYKILELLQYIKIAIENGEDIYKALEPYKDKIDNEIIYFFKLASNKGELLDIVKVISHILRKKYDNKKLLMSKLSYPLVVLVSFIISLIMIFTIVIPKFEYIFTQYNMKLPLATKLLLNTKDFFASYSLLLVIAFILFAMTFKYFYKKNYQFSFQIDKYILKIPLIGKMILIKDLYNFFISLNILLSAKFDFSHSLKNAIFLLKNKYLLDRITFIKSQLENGHNISDTFSSVNIFDDVVLSLIDTGVQSTSLDITTNEIVKIYEQYFNKSIKNFSSMIEPVFFIGIMLLILWVILSIFVPLWSMQEVISV